jgi:DNA (cytosine-5)-methyltransferase 1
MILLKIQERGSNRNESPATKEYIQQYQLQKHNGKIKMLSLFSGYGGFELGAIQAIGAENIEVVGFSEIDKYAIQIYQKHFPTHKNYGSITGIDASTIPDFDLLVGGFPCQAFSIAGKRAGFEDTRGTLIYDVLRIVKEKHPRLVLLENVKGLLSHDSGRTFKTIITALAELGYAVEWQVLNAKNFGVPQNRERVFIIGHLGTCQKLVFPIQYKNDISYNEKMYWLPEELASDTRELLLRIQERQGKELSSTEMQSLLEGIGEAIRKGQPCEVEKLSENIRSESEGNIQKIETLGAFLESVDDTGRVCGMVQEPTEEMLLLWSQREPVEGTPGQVQQQDDKNDHRQNGLIERLRNGESMPLLFAMQPYQGRLFFSIGDGKDWENIYQTKMETVCETALSSILEDSVDDKYFLSDEYVKKLMDYNKRQKENNRGFSAPPRQRNGISPALIIGGGMKDDLVYDN